MTYSTSSSSTSKKFRSTSRYKSDSSLSSDSSCSAPSLNSTSNSDSVSNGSFYQPGFSFFDQGNVSYDYHDGAYSPFEASMQRIQSNQFKPQQAFPHKTKLTKKDREKLRLEKIEVKKVLSKKMVKFSELSDSLAASAPPAQLENPTPSFTKDLFKIDESKEQEMFTKAEELFNDGCYIATAQQFTLICFYTSNPQSKCRAFKEGISAIGYAENKRYAEDQKRAEGEKKGPVNPQFHNNLYFGHGSAILGIAFYAWKIY